jgi:hypothetical protein
VSFSTLSRTFSPGARAAAALSVFFASWMISSTAFAVGKNLVLGVDGQYSLLGRRADTGVGSLHGGAAGVHISYSFTDTWRLSLSGDHAFYQSYMTQPQTAVEGNGETDTNGNGQDGEDIVDGNVEQDQPSVSVSAVQLSSLALSVEYLVDIMRVMPFFAIGIIATRTYERVETAGDEETAIVGTASYDIGYRISLGFDYMLLGYLGLGAVLVSDNYITESSAYLGKLSILLRVTFCLDMGRFGMCRAET